MTRQELATQTESPIAEINNANDIMMNGSLMNQIDLMAKRMATSKATIPDHLKDNEGDCWAIVMQSVQWGMNPFVVAQKTHVVSGKLGYEAQLVNALIQNSGMIQGSFHYEYKGEGANLECRCGAVLKGDKSVTWGEWLKFSSVTIKNSPLWKTNPKQQMAYLQCKNWGRIYCPGAILGIYTVDELRDNPIPSEREVGPGATASDLNDMLKHKTEAPQDNADDAEVIETAEERADPEPEQSAETVATINAEINAVKTAEDMAKVRANILNFLSDPDNKKFGDELNAAYKHKVAEFKKQQEAEAFGDE